MANPLDALAPDRPRYADHPEFFPDFSPKSVLAAGAFDGGYFHARPASDLDGIDPEILAAGPHLEKPDAKRFNAFHIHSGLDHAAWTAKGWIRPQDPNGWFQWYCRFHSGRRSEDDERQIGRWVDFRKRWQPKTPEALERMRPGAKTRQALLHWAIDPWLPEHGLGIDLD